MSVHLDGTVTGDQGAGGSRQPPKLPPRQGWMCFWPCGALGRAGISGRLQPTAPHLCLCVKRAENWSQVGLGAFRELKAMAKPRTQGCVSLLSPGTRDLVGAHAPAHMWGCVMGSPEVA